MRLGSQTGSVINHVMSNVSGTPKPEVGMGATILAWTDRHAGTITEVRANGDFVVQADHAERTDNNGMSESQQYSYSANPDGRTWTFRLVRRGKNKGRYAEKGAPQGHGVGVLIGDRRQYHDFSF